jgi:tetratricopeptide (TPR) repeat protein
MNWFTSLFTKRPNKIYTNEEHQSVKKSQTFELYEKGKENFLDKEMYQALLNFDEAIENGFTVYFQNYNAELFDLRARCLQELKFDFDAIRDFDKSISLSGNDCNTFFARSLSKTSVLDYVGAILDLEKAIELSKIDNEINREYNAVAREQGNPNGACDFFAIRLLRAKMELSWELESKQKIENASTQDEKQFRQELYDQDRLKKLNRIKHR